MDRRHFLTTAAASLAGTTFASPPPAATVPRTFQSTAERVSVLELFTSEGCSSCPPADAWVSRLREAPGLWSQFIPLAWHVDYWDSLGWKDPFASAANSKRQRQYAAQWRSNSVYTPGFVLNGEEWRVRALELPKAAPAGILKLAQGAATAWSLAFDTSHAGKDTLIYHLAWLVSAETQVTAGENAGRTLPHDFMVLGHTWIGSDNGHAALQLPPHAQAKAVAGWVSRATDPTPLQAVGGEL